MADLDIIAKVVRPKVKSASLPFLARVIRPDIKCAYPVPGGFSGFGRVAGVTQTGSPPVPSRAKIEIRPDIAARTRSEPIPLLAEAWSKEDGSFIIRSLKAGRYRVTVSADGFFPRMFLTDVVEGE